MTTHTKRGGERGGRLGLFGAMTAIVTPFKSSGEIDQPALERLIQRQIDAGIHGLVPCGTTGETPTLSVEEQDRVVGTTVALVKKSGRAIAVIAGTGSNSTAATVQATRRVRELGVDAALVVTPYYNKPTQEGLYRHYRTVAEEAGLPIVAYNVPGRTGVDLLPETVARIVKDVPGVVALKEAVADTSRLCRLRALAGDQLSWLSGDDGNLLPFLAVGGHGVISVTANVDPAGVVAVCERFFAGDLEAARQTFYAQLPLHEGLFVESNPIPVKAALAMLELCTDAVRLPLWPMTAEKRPALEKLLRARGLLGKPA